MLVVSHLEKHFGRKAVLRDVSFVARPGEVLGLLGPNGAGKTTTLRIITGCLAASRGEVSLDGQDLARAACTWRRRIGYLPENVPLYPEMRVAEYLEYRAALKDIPARERRARLTETAAQVGVSDALDQVIGRLSRGYRQRVGLCDALMHRPPILILDEPTEGLDPNQRAEVLGLVRRLGRERTVLLSTHVLAEAEQLCGRVIILDHGRVVGEGAPDELVPDRSGYRVRLEARGDAAVLGAALSSLAGVEEVTSRGLADGWTAFTVRAREDARAAAAQAVLQAGGSLRELRLEAAGLGQAFAALTAKSPPAEAREP